MRLNVLLALLPAVLGASVAKRDQPAPLIANRDVSSLIADKYIVKFKDGGLLSVLDDVLGALSIDAERQFKNAFKGFAGHLDKATLSILRDHPEVEYIEQDSKVSAADFISQEGATWGLTRISHIEAGATTYDYDESAGSGACAYVIDTGVDVGLEEFGGRATMVANFSDNDENDVNGHGTHVAGTIGSATYGVAKNVNIYGIKVLNDDGVGAMSSIISGMDFVTGDAATRDCPNGVVVNMSISGGQSDASNQAAAALVSNGVFVAVAAGNDGDDAANHSPASEPTVCTVGAITEAGEIASFSNYGGVVDIFAPGDGITSVTPGGEPAAMSGTSMASPHIAGLAAYFGSLEGWESGAAMCDRLVSAATEGKIAGIPDGTTSRLAFNANPSG